MTDLNKSQRSKPTVHFDPDEYMHYLDGMDVTDEQATEILRTLWDIMVQFVDLGFTVNGTAESTLNDKGHSAAKLDSKIAQTQNTKGRTS